MPPAPQKPRTITIEERLRATGTRRRGLDFLSLDLHTAFVLLFSIVIVLELVLVLVSAIWLPSEHLRKHKSNKFTLMSFARASRVNLRVMATPESAAPFSFSAKTLLNCSQGRNLVKTLG
jgi:hypothetical protein